jgi:YD repeat-containing protein
VDANTPATFEVFGYDALSNQTSHQLADGNTNTATFDSLNRVATMSYFDGQNVAYGYTLNGQRQTVTDKRGVTTYNYDALDRVTSIVQPNGQSVSGLPAFLRCLLPIWPTKNALITRFYFSQEELPHRSVFGTTSPGRCLRGTFRQMLLH